MQATQSPANPGRGTGRPKGRADEHRDQDIVGASPRMQRIFKLVAKVAATESAVLLTGESGTGKELVARSLHLQSRRAAGPFVPVHVGAIPETLIEAELFGHVRGAFTGAGTERVGLIEEADRGTLFLDEVGDMPAIAQVKLLRTLENNEVRRIGDNAARVVDVRVVAATHRDLKAEMDAGRFRADLYYRLNVVTIELPPLRERREDIGLLASYFLDRIGRRDGRAGLRFDPEAEHALERYDYPGNVRELEHAVEHAIAVAEGEWIRLADLPASIRIPPLLPQGSGPAPLATAAHAPEGATGGSVSPDATAAAGVRDTWSLAEIEREHIARVLARHYGNASAAARQLGISRTTLWRKLRAYGLARTGGPR